MKKQFVYFIALSLLVFASCKKSDDPVQPTPTPNTIITPLNDNSLPSGALVGFKLLNKTSSQLEYSLDVAVFRDSKNMENQLKAESFRNDTLASGSTKYFFSVENAERRTDNSSTAYSALMLMDQSGSISSTDPKNNRLDAATAFCRNLGAADNVSPWSFQGSSYQQYGAGFTRDTGFLINAIKALKGKETGSTPLYLAQNNAVDYCYNNAVNANKAVLTFTDGADNNSAGTTSQQVINNATVKNIKLFNIGLDAAETPILVQQALSTRGAFMYAKDARQLISMFGNLGKLLASSATYYHTTWKVNRSSGNFTSGNLQSSVTVLLPYGGTVTIPFSIDY